MKRMRIVSDAERLCTAPGGTVPNGANSPIYVVLEQKRRNTMQYNNVAVDDTIMAAFEKIVQVHRVLIWDSAKKYKLSPIQIHFLLFIHKSSKEMRRISSIAREFDLTVATVSDAVRVLGEKKLVCKQRSEEDGRSYILSLTQKGVKAAQALDGWQNALREHMQNVSDADKSVVVHFMLELLRSLHDDGILSVARMCITCANFIKNNEPGSNTPHLCGLTGRRISDTTIRFGCVSHHDAESELSHDI